MLTDTEIGSLAKEVLTRILLGERAAPLFLEVIETEAGELIPIFGGVSEDGYGAIRCEYIPLQAIKKIIVVCESLFDEYAPQFHENAYSSSDRVVVIEAMADTAVLHLIATFSMRLRELVEDAVDESSLIASGFIAASTAKHLTQTQQQGKLSADIRPGIEKAAAGAAEKRKALLRHYLKALPNLLVERKRGGSRAKHYWTDNQFAELTRKYDELKVVWLDAKRIAKDAQKARSPKRNQQWREEVLRAYPELPQDLLERFAHLRADDARPSDIALLHAQRECGVTAPYTARELREKIRAWKLKQQQSGSAETPDNAEPES